MNIMNIEEDHFDILVGIFSFIAKQVGKLEDCHKNIELVIAEVLPAAFGFIGDSIWARPCIHDR